MNPEYVSLEMAKELKKVIIEFPESGRVWANAEFRRVDIETGEMNTFKIEIYSLFSGLDKDCIIRTQKFSSYNIFPAPSLSEILDELPGCAVFLVGDTWYCGKVIRAEGEQDWKGVGFYIYKGSLTEDTTAPDAAAKMLIKLKENK